MAIRVGNLGTVLYELGDLAGAKAAYERALQIDEAAYGPDHPIVANRINNLGWVLHDLGDLTGAKAAFEHAIQILKKRLPEGHPHIKVIQQNLEPFSNEK